MIATFFPSCHCTDAEVIAVSVGRSVAPMCGKCGAIYGTEKPLVRLDIVEECLIELATKVHYSRRDDTGEASTRRVQEVASRALNALRGIT